MEIEAVKSSGDPNFAPLESEDSHTRYFNLLCGIFRKLIRGYLGEENKSYEAKVIAAFLTKLLYTSEILQVKFGHRHAYRDPLYVDLVDSGFPNSITVNEMTQDLLTRADRLKEIPATQILKRELLNQLLVYGEDPDRLLAMLAERTYLEMLDEEKVFLDFTPGELALHHVSEEERSYVFSWGCYDFKTNRPYVHIITFTQDSREEPLENEGQSYSEFMRVIRSEGSRAPSVSTLALMIDEALEPIHPKIIKRLCIGPLYAKLFNSTPATSEEDVKQGVFRNLLREYGRKDDDFVLFVSDEIIFSKLQKVTRSILSPLGKVREIFAITETDPECFKRQASVVHNYVLLPHWVLQHVKNEELESVPQFRAARKMTYNDQGEVLIHGIDA